MADPTKFTPGYSFTDWQTSNPTKPLPGNKVDQDMANLETSIDEIVDAIKDVRRSDGKLKNGIVTPDSLSPAALSGLVPAATALAEQYRDEAAAAAVSAVAAQMLAQDAADASTAAAAAAEVAEEAAVTLVQQATSGFVGFVDGLGYDFGSVATDTTYFNQDWGGI